jgi:hypothetical protein
MPESKTTATPVLKKDRETDRTHESSFGGNSVKFNQTTLFQIRSLDEREKKCIQNFGRKA